jgi:radical SAM superfamily enzyme
MDGELAGLMKRVGFTEACFGVEACCDAMLASLGKNYTVEHVRSAARAVQAAGIPIQFFLLLGAPGETLATVRETLRTIREVARPFDLVNIGIGVRLYQGSQMSADWEKAHGRPADSFLKPLAYEPDGVSLQRIKAEVAKGLTWRHNWFMFEDQAAIPLGFRLCFNLVFPRHPIFRGYIGMRILEKASGLFLLRLLRNRLKYGALRD